jgi:hypothetical protein
MLNLRWDEVWIPVSPFQRCPSTLLLTKRSTEKRRDNKQLGVRTRTGRLSPLPMDRLEGFLSDTIDDHVRRKEQRDSEAERVGVRIACGALD